MARIAPDRFHVTTVVFQPSSGRDRRRGLLGWVGVTLNGGLRLEGIALRRSLEGRLFLAFPARLDRARRRRYAIRPLNGWVRDQIERQVFEHLDLGRFSSR